MTKDEAFQQYKEAIALIDLQSREARAKARATLHEQLTVFQATLHNELRDIRAIQQKTRRSKK